MEDRNKHLLTGIETETLDMQTVAALAKIVSEGFELTVRRDQAEFEILANLLKRDLEINGTTRIPLNFRGRARWPKEGPPLWIGIESRGLTDGLCLELPVGAFLQTKSGDTEARLVSRFGLVKMAQCAAKYGISRSVPSVMKEFENLDAHENCEATCAAVFSLVTPPELEALKKTGTLDAETLVSNATIDLNHANVIIEIFQRHREALLAPRLPTRWNHVRFIETNNWSLRRLK